MRAEQDVLTLREVKTRMELLIAYYQTMGERERAFASVLEVRLGRVSAALRRQCMGDRRP